MGNLHHQDPLLILIVGENHHDIRVSRFFRATRNGEPRHHDHAGHDHEHDTEAARQAVSSCWIHGETHDYFDCEKSQDWMTLPSSRHKPIHSNSSFVGFRLPSMRS